MSRTPLFRVALLGAPLFLAACSDTGNPVGTLEPATPTLDAAVNAQQALQAPNIISASGDITAAVTQYRNILGKLNANVAGEQRDGRREINWDGVPAAFTNTNTFPANFFNVNSPRGVLFRTNGTGFRISDNGYTDVNPNYAGEFNFFSPVKLFVAVDGNITDVQFVVAGSNTPAVVTGFGSVFGDVGLERSTTIEYFDAAGTSLLVVNAPVRSDAKGLSFVGAKFGARIVARVRITSGNTPIGATVDDNVKEKGVVKRDIVAMDDFIYGEPRSIAQ